jgi:predicted membrane protein
VNLIVGLLAVVLGVLFLVSFLHIFEMRSPMKYFWSAVFLSIGFALVIEHRDERTWQWGIGWILVGIWSFAHTSGWIFFDIWDVFWPLFLLGVGGYLVRRALTEDRDPPANAEPGTTRPSDRTIRGVGVLSGSELKPTTQAMERAELFALMGGVKLDLYDAQLVNDAATINVAACMGGIEILVPSDWTVISNVLPLMGAFIDKRRPAAGTTTAATKKTLTISGFVLMGGVEIKN